MKLLLSKDKRYFLVNDISIEESNKLRKHLSYISPFFWVLKKKYPWKYPDWNGEKYFIDKDMQIPRGLWNDVYGFAKKENIKIEIYGISHIMDNDFKYDEFREFCLSLFNSHPVYTPYDYQIEAAAKIIKYKFSQSEIATSAGKTLISYMIFMWLKKKLNLKKQLIIVPRLTLVSQLIDDFNEYANGDYEFSYQEIIGGSDKLKKDVDFVVGTYQSLIKLPKTWYNEIDSLFVDECHYAGSSSIKKIIMKIDNNLLYKIGLSGTIEQKDRGIILTTQSFLGPIIQTISPTFLMDGGFATNVKIEVYKLDYLLYEHRKQLQEVRASNIDDATKSLSLEKDIVRNNNDRFLFICNKILECNDNSLVLFADIKNGYGKRFYEYLNSKSSKRVYYIDGSTSSELRNYYKQTMESNDVILVASYGTLSTGVSIKNISNIFMTESYKSRTIVMQSMGRGMRKKEGKDYVKIFDFIDDFRVESKLKKHINYVYQHGNERIGYYHKYYESGNNCSLDIFDVKLGKQNVSLF